MRRLILIFTILTCLTLTIFGQDKLEWSETRKLTVNDLKATPPDPSTRQSLISNLGLEVNLKKEEIQSDECRENQNSKCRGNRRETTEMSSRNERTKNRVEKKISEILFSTLLSKIVGSWILHLLFLSLDSDTNTIRESN